MTDEIALVELTEQQTAVLRDRVPHDGIAEFLGRAFGTVMGAVTGGGRTIVGPPSRATRPWTIPGGTSRPASPSTGRSRVPG